MKQQGVLLVNLGSPASPSIQDVRQYLREFLMDEHVIDLPFLARFLVVHGLILPFRPGKSAEAYQKIWTPAGLPLVVTSRRLQAELQKRLPQPVALAMRYGEPSISSAITHLQAEGVDELLLVPLFPHNSMSSYGTAVARVKAVAGSLAPEMSLKILGPFYHHPEYIGALVESAQGCLKQGYDHLLFSFHGLPERYLRKSDPNCGRCLEAHESCQASEISSESCYRAQCFKTVEAFVAQAAVRNYSVAFQSRLGHEPWLQPYTSSELERLAQAGVRRLLVICPAFVADCLETLEEIALRGRETFLQAGGREFQLIPCLNEHPRWIAALKKLIDQLSNSQNPLPS